MAQARFDVRFNDATAATDEPWTERASTRPSSSCRRNLGEDLRPLARIVSGGELSRVMLALKTMSADDTEHKTMVFDEVDAGIGGRVADVVGRASGRAGRLDSRCCASRTCRRSRPARRRTSRIERASGAIDT
jgi:DNA repair protein RecN (Recombination protein N)